jgi:autotransporter-associated beta strand protein
VGSKLQLNATSPGSDARFAFFIDNELQLLHDLEVTGDGTQDFVIRGGIRDYYESRNVAKTGTSDLTLSGANAFTGTFTINGGDVTVTGPAASIDGASAIVIGGAGRLAFEEGAITVGTIDNSSGGLFDFSGGRLSVANVVGDLVNDGGILAPGNSSGTTAITGDFSQSSGTLAIELGGLVPGESFDQLAVSGAATLGGTLDISMIGDGAGLFLPDVGSTFEIVTAADGISARFEDELLPEIIGDSFVDWAVHYGSNEVALEVLSLSPASDFDLDGTVAGGDFLIWQTGFGMSSGASHSEGDADGDGDVDGDDFLVWQRQFGSDTGRGAAAVPEPASLLLLAALATLITGRGIGR